MEQTKTTDLELWPAQQALEILVDDILRMQGTCPQWSGDNTHFLSERATLQVQTRRRAGMSLAVSLVLAKKFDKVLCALPFYADTYDLFRLDEIGVDNVELVDARRFLKRENEQKSFLKAMGADCLVACDTTFLKKKELRQLQRIACNTIGHRRRGLLVLLSTQTRIVD